MMDDSDQLDQGRAAFNRGEYFCAHELWEKVWHQMEGPGRIFVQGLIQIAAGLHHLQQHRPRPAAGLLRKGLEKLSRGAPGPLVHLRVEVLVHDLAQTLAEIESPGATVPDPTTCKL
jgi:predicted metal-dependent hydrolase